MGWILKLSLHSKAGMEVTGIQTPILAGVGSQQIQRLSKMLWPRRTKAATDYSTIRANTFGIFVTTAFRVIICPGS